MKKADFCVLHPCKCVVMNDGVRGLTVPSQNLVNAPMVGPIVKAAGLTVKEFREIS